MDAKVSNNPQKAKKTVSKICGKEKKCLPLQPQTGKDGFAQPQHGTADMAQLVEQRIRNAWVPGSSPGIGSR